MNGFWDKFNAIVLHLQTFQDNCCCLIVCTGHPIQIKVGQRSQAEPNGLKAEVHSWICQWSWPQLTWTKAGWHLEWGYSQHVVAGHSIYRASVNRSSLAFHQRGTTSQLGVNFQFILFPNVRRQKLNKRLLQGFFPLCSPRTVCCPSLYWLRPLTSSHQIIPAFLALSNQSRRDMETVGHRNLEPVLVSTVIGLTSDQLQCSWPDQLMFL